MSAVARAVAAAQAVLRESDSALVIDGKPGSYTKSVYDKASPQVQADVDRVMAALGLSGGLTKAHETYLALKASAVSAPDQRSSKTTIFDLQIVPAVVRECRKRGLNPVNFVTQLCLESGYGASSPLTEDGKPSYNYGGIKWASVKTDRFTARSTKEFVRGREIDSVEKFAVFDSADHFAKSYLDYLLDGPSSYRYRGIERAKTPLEFGTILLRGKYATDPAYATKFAATAKRVENRYALA